MRRGELLELKWSDLDFERQTIFIRNPKRGESTTIPMNPLAYQVLMTHPKVDDYIFPKDKGGKRSEYGKGVYRIKQAAGLPDDFRPLHGLRHSFASFLADNGIPKAFIQQLLGHKTSAITDRYVHLNQQAIKEASNRLAQLLPGVDSALPTH